MKPPRGCAARQGYTLIEVLVATTLTLIMMAAVVQVFGLVGRSVSDSRALLEMNGRLRAAANRLQLDLAGETAPMLPPLKMAEDPGYFEIIEGPVMCLPGQTVAIDTTTGNPIAIDANGISDQTVGDFDDILMFTTRSLDQPFVGRWIDPNDGKSKPIESHVAEVVWFVRGGNLYRRLLLVLPGLRVQNTRAGFYANNDVSVRYENGRVVANSLGELTRRENRYAHPTGTFPFDVQGWGAYGLPTLGETSQPNWNVGIQTASNPGPWAKTDFWHDPKPKEGALGVGTRPNEDIILSNVIGFDVKVWDPAAPVRDASGNKINGAFGAYVDLGDPNGDDITFRNNYDSRSKLTRTYDTWTDYYEDTLGGGQRNNGFDDNGNGVIDDIMEGVTGAPYRVPLRGIQVKIRVFEPDSRQVREVTIVQDFMPK